MKTNIPVAAKVVPAAEAMAASVSVGHVAEVSVVRVQRRRGKKIAS